MYVDGKPSLMWEDVACIFINNGKMGGGRNILNSFGLINDGVVEIGLVKNVISKKGLLGGAI